MIDDVSYKATKRYKGFVIAERTVTVGSFNTVPAVRTVTEYDLYTAEEWAFGKGCRYPEMEGISTLQQAKEWVDSY